jgi:hypothetical protein
VALSALLAVLLAIGLGNLAWATDGQPLIVGQENTATHPTTLDGDFNAGHVTAQTLNGNLQGGLITLSGTAEGGAADVALFAPGQTKITIKLPRPTDAASSKGSDADYPLVQVLGHHPRLRAMADTSPHVNPFTHASNPVTLTIWLNRPAAVPIRVFYVIVGVSSD